MHQSKWTYDAADETYKIGWLGLGAGVFLDDAIGGDEMWWGNVVTPAAITMIGPFNTREDAQKCAEERLAEHRNG